MDGGQCPRGADREPVQRRILEWACRTHRVGERRAADEFADDEWEAAVAAVSENRCGAVRCWHPGAPLRLVLRSGPCTRIILKAIPDGLDGDATAGIVGRQVYSALPADAQPADEAVATDSLRVSRLEGAKHHYIVWHADPGIDPPIRWKAWITA